MGIARHSQLSCGTIVHMDKQSKIDIARRSVKLAVNAVCSQEGAIQSAMDVSQMRYETAMGSVAYTFLRPEGSNARVEARSRPHRARMETLVWTAHDWLLWRPGRHMDFNALYGGLAHAILSLNPGASF